MKTFKIGKKTYGYRKDSNLAVAIEIGKIVVAAALIMANFIAFASL